MKKKFNIDEFTNIFKDVILDGNKILCPANIYEVIKFAAENYSFDILKSITAVDTQGNGTELTYRLYSPSNDEETLFSTVVKEETPTVTDIFKSAIADENEIYDMFGIKFTGNENLKRLYMPENWDGYPLRKDYTENDTRLAWNDDNNA